MKPFKALLLTSLVLGACEKSNDVTQLHEEAVSVAKWYGPRVDDMMKRREVIFQKGRSVPGNLPDVPQIVKMIGEAGEKLNEMKAIASAGTDGKSAMEKQADQLQKDGKADELRKLIDENQDKLDEDWTIANDDLTHVEGWLWQYEQSHNNAPPSPPAPPEATPNTTGQAPGAAAPEGAGSAAATEEPKAEDTKEPTIEGKKAEPKAAEPKAEKKAAPKAEAPKAAGEKGGNGAPKAAAPKAGAGSAAK
jgi:hypothetical protein